MSNVAIIIPTHNRAQLLARVIESCQRQTVPADIFVMDDASPDETPQMIRQRFPTVHYHREEKKPWAYVSAEQRGGPYLRAIPLYDRR